MQYLALIHTNEDAWEALSDAERLATRERYGSLYSEGMAAGVIVGGSELAAETTATTVRIRNDETLVTDGPFAELKEALGGYFVFECESIDDACSWAAKIPAAATGAIEVRQVHEQEEQS